MYPKWANGGYDFLPLNYGNTTFNEAWGAPNNWFGMTSSINFFLPNPTGFQDANNEYGNRSTVGDEMVYKFSGDDDVWVFVDDNLVLDMGGIPNNPGVELPSTGGNGTVWYNRMGLALILLAGCLLIVNRRKAAKK